MESKMEIYDLLPIETYPKTILHKTNEDFTELLHKINASEIKFPFIAKPDIGLKGKAVQKIKDLDSLHRYADAIKTDFLIQELINFPLEAGIFYYRYPNEKKGIISGIVVKEFMILTGDGKSTIEDLIKKNNRYLLQLNALKKMHGDLLCKILKEKEEINLMPYGNHARGSKFTDETWRANEKLNQMINDICINVKGFYFGRLDIKFSSWEELEEGKSYSIIELNAAGSEPTHIYDPAHSIFFAWKEIAKHWNIMHEIARINFKNGTKYITFKEGIEMLKGNIQLIDQLEMQASELKD